MDFDRFTIAMLVLREDAPQLTPVEEDALQDSHLAYLSGLHDAGQLLAAGPLIDPQQSYRGLAIYSAGLAEATALAEADPAVVAGKLRVVLLPWLVPGGAMSFTPGTRFPRSAAEAAG